MTNPFEHPELQGLVELIELQLEDQLSPEQFAELEQTIRSSDEARRLYIEYLDLHGVLHWDLALTGDSASPAEVAASGNVATRGQPESPVPQRKFTRTAIAASACSLAALAVLIVALLDTGDAPDQPSLAGTGENSSLEINQPSEDDSLDVAVADAGTATGNGLSEATVVNIVDPTAMNSVKQPETDPPKTPGSTDRNSDPGTTIAVASNPDSPSPREPDNGAREAAAGRFSEAVVAKIDRLIRAGWKDNEVLPSKKADDSEWLRRVYLDTVGHIPTADQVRKFLADKSPNKRAVVVDTLLDDEDYIRNWTTIWTNLLIGRSNPREVNRPALQKFLRESFARNHGWDDVVADFISAEGSHEENGATNFLLAHLNNQAVPATAITAKVFLGQQLHCTQCHNHPFNNQTQDEFWAFNSFFKQIEVRDRPISENPRLREVVLRNTNKGGPTFYETRQGVMKAVFPSFEGHRIDADDNVNRREELARLMTEGDSPQIARAFVNRMWLHFFGAGFTPQVDDMGPHVAVSHPELLDTLTQEFVRSGYDAKQLMRWICNSEAYGLTSRIREDSANIDDDPTIGNEPLFSRVYVKQMSVEQLFDSLLIATDAQEVFGSSWEAVEQHRQEWLQQFVMAWETDENDEANLFDGTIPQALMMMNGDLVDLALNSNKSTLLNRVARSNQSENQKIETIALAALSRKPSRQETTAVRKMIRESARSARSADQQLAMRTGLQDLFWACLNSNEFILIH